MIYDVRYDGQGYTADTRAALTPEGLDMHNDSSMGEAPANYISLLCLQTARSGGKSSLSSAYAAHNHFLTAHPDLIERLYQPFYRDKQEYQAPDANNWYPIFALEDAGLRHVEVVPAVPERAPPERVEALGDPGAFRILAHRSSVRGQPPGHAGNLPPVILAARIRPSGDPRATPSRGGGMATGGWRGDYFIERDWVEGQVREKAWQELVCRLAGAMRLLTKAKAAGREDIPVEHRMSGFWAFVLAIAEQEGGAVLADFSATMTAVDTSQIAASEMGDDFLDLITEVLTCRKEFQRRWIPARELKTVLDSWTGLGRASLSQALRTIIGSSFALHRRLSSSNAYRTRLGFQEREKRHVREYWFELPEEVQS
jgi:hypothetical protein